MSELAAYGVSWTTETAWATALIGNWTAEQRIRHAHLWLLLLAASARAAKSKAKKGNDSSSSSSSSVWSNSLGRCPLLALIGLVFRTCRQAWLIPISVLPIEATTRDAPKDLWHPRAGNDDAEVGRIAWGMLRLIGKHVARGTCQGGGHNTRHTTLRQLVAIV